VISLNIVNGTAINDLINQSRQAWDERRGLSKEDAKSMYIKLVEDFMPNFMNKAQGQGNEDEDDIFMTDEEYNSRKVGWSTQIT